MIFRSTVTEKIWFRDKISIPSHSMSSLYIKDRLVNLFFPFELGSHFFSCCWREENKRDFSKFYLVEDLVKKYFLPTSSTCCNCWDKSVSISKFGLFSQCVEASTWRRRTYSKTCFALISVMIIHLDLLCAVESTRWIHITINTDETEIRTDSRHKIWGEHLATDYYQHHGKKRVWTQDKRLLLSLAH